VRKKYDVNSKVHFLEVFPFIIILVIYWPLIVLMLSAQVIVYYILKNYYLEKRKWDLNFSCGNTDGGDINADILKRYVPNFVLIKDIYNLPFKDKQFTYTLCSHTIEHVDYPERFYKELKRISKNIVLVVPPIWDLSALLNMKEHKWHFLTFKTMHMNNIPKGIKLTPWWWLREKMGWYAGP